MPYYIVINKIKYPKVFILFKRYQKTYTNLIVSKSILTHFCIPKYMLNNFFTTLTGSCSGDNCLRYFN